MSASHTPGPWRIGDEDDFDGLPIHAPTMPEGEVVPIANIEVDFDDREEREANARLIAAVPDLLEALKFIARLTGPNGEILYESGCQSIAMHAIAKAKGVSA